MHVHVHIKSYTSVYIYILSLKCKKDNIAFLQCACIYIFEIINPFIIHVILHDTLYSTYALHIHMYHSIVILFLESNILADVMESPKADLDIDKSIPFIPVADSPAFEPAPLESFTDTDRYRYVETVNTGIWFEEVQAEITARHTELRETQIVISFESYFMAFIDYSVK